MSSASGYEGFEGFDPATGEFREPAPPPKARVEYPSRASLRKQGRRGAAPSGPIVLEEPVESPAGPVSPPTSPITVTRTSPVASPMASPVTSPVTSPVPPVSPPVSPPARSLAERGTGTPAITVAADEPGREPARSGPSAIPRAVAALVALAGILLVAGGILQSTMFKPRTTITASLADPPSQPIVVSAPGLLGLDGTRVQVTASGPANRPVFVGIGRASDVMAYLGAAKRETVTGESGDGVLVAKNEGNQATLPDPGSVDVWVLSQRAPGAAGVSWPNVPGQYVVVAASDGSGAAPARLTFTWTGAKPHSLGAAMIAVGAVFVICGLVLLIMLISRARLERLE